MTSSEIFEQIKLFLPKYLTPAEQEELFSELAKFPNNQNFYLREGTFQGTILQGDGWRGFVAINFRTGERKTISGVVLSNSCDIDQANSIPTERRILFAPLIRLQSFVQVLKSAGQAAVQVQSRLDAIRKQHVTSIFYLPTKTGVIEESVVLLDDIHGHPIDDFTQCDRLRLFILNQFAFYLFLIKLSIHFARFNESVHRFESSASGPT